MSTWKKICCPTDLSEASRAALGQAAAIARESRAELILLHVSARGGHAAGGEALLAPPPRPAVHPDRDEGRLKIWTEEAERLAPGAVTSIELMGSPAEEIVRCAREFGCDLLVMGTHGRSGIGHLALGSVAEAVIRAAPCPVLVVRPQAE
jgi:nucleotide-binding universal stress UspA family protein